MLYLHFLNRQRLLASVFIILLSACSHQPDKGDGSAGQSRGNNGENKKPNYDDIPPELRTGNEGRYSVDQDFEPILLLNPETIQDAIPKPEVVKKAGNKSPYTVLGKTYTVMKPHEASGYKERGGASWYGLKFHGHKTSNGETYSIYAMSAAHKTLPIPSYVKVTNLANGKTAVVRVNDRGPFHQGRIIDLSYAAATKLDYIDKGTAQVEVELIDVAVVPERPRSSSEQWFIQLAAYSNPEVGNAQLKQLMTKTSVPLVLIAGKDGLSRLRMGPMSTDEISLAMSEAKRLGFASAHKVKAP